MPWRAIVPYLVLLIGISIASTASILIRFAQQEGMPSLTIAAGRLGLAALILTPLALVRVRGELQQLQRRDMLLGIGAGIFLAAHFATWISSLEYTSVANSAALVSTNPLWVGLAAWLVLGERPTPGIIVGLVLTMAGTLLIIFSGLDDTARTQFANPTLGNVLAVLGALGVAGYFLIGRGLRQRVSLLAYIWVVYSSGAVTLWLVLLLQSQSVLGFSALAYLMVLGLAVGPQLLGHTSFNWALGHLSATFVAVALLGEPIGSAVLAWFIFDERIDPLSPAGIVQLTGFAALLTGIYISAMDEARQRRRTPDEPQL